MEGVFMSKEEHSIRRKIRFEKYKKISLSLMLVFFFPYMVAVCLQGIHGKCEQKQNVYWEPYFLGVLAKECPKESELEFLKAQAVLIRTRLYQQMDKEQEFQYVEAYLRPEEMAEKWRGLDYDHQYEMYKKAMTDTEGEVLTYGADYAWVPYHKSSNGKTRSALEVLKVEYPYLTAKECPKDEQAIEEYQTGIYEYEEVQTQCSLYLQAVGEEEVEQVFCEGDYEILSYDSSGYVNELRIGKSCITGEQFRDALHLPSSCFTLRDVNGKLQITTTGRGHGIGMSQWTANEMAKEGKNYQEILNYFFEGAELKKGCIIHFQSGNDIVRGDENEEE